MPVPTFCNECTHLQTGGKVLTTYRDTPGSMCWLKDEVHPSTYLDTPGILDCNSTYGPTALNQKAAIGHSDHLPFEITHDSVDSMRAVVNIEISADSVIRTHVSLYEPHTISVHSTSAIMTDEQSDSSSSPPIFATPISDVHRSTHQLGLDGMSDALDVSSLRKALYSVDPSVYTDVCAPLAHWVANHVWKVTTQGLSLPLAFVDSA